MSILKNVHLDQLTNIQEFLDENVVIKGSYKITPNYVINVKGDVFFKRNSTCTSLTNGWFEWGDIEGGIYCYACPNLTSLKGAPKKVEIIKVCNCDKFKSIIKEHFPKKFDKVIFQSCGSLDNDYIFELLFNKMKVTLLPLSKPKKEWY